MAADIASPAITSLIAANITFVGSHFVLSHPLRAGLVRALGAKGFMGVYSLISLGAMAWIVMAFRAAGPGGALVWNGQAVLPWTVGSALTLVALVLLIGSFKGNPALPDAPVALVRAGPAGIFTVTRHPMLWSFALWAMAHILVSPSPRTLITAGAMGVLALVGAKAQDAKKAVLMGADWQGWEARTTFLPRWSKLAGVGAGLWIAALAIWLGLTWAHIPAAGIPAGVWRWVG